MKTQIANDIIKIVSENYNYDNNSQWHPERIKALVSLVDKAIADKLEYSNPNIFVRSIQKELNVDVYKYLKEHKFSSYVETNEYSDINKTKDTLVITYVPENSEDFKECFDSIKSYAEKVGADFFALQAGKQGYEYLERFRIKSFVENYDRTIFLDYNIFVKDECPNLFDIVPKGMIGIQDNYKDYEELIFAKSLFDKKRLRLLKSEHFSRIPYISSEVADALLYEAKETKTFFNNCVIICDKEHSDIFDPIDFPITDQDHMDQIWIDTCINRSGHEVFNLEDKYNCNIVVNPNKANESYVVQYPFRLHAHASFKNRLTSSNVKISWINDNNIIGYKNKERFDLSKFDILCVGHSEDQLKSIEDRYYLRKINLNDFERSEDDLRFCESFLYTLEFDELFRKDAEYVGMVTGSWNKKYIGLNPIDKLDYSPGLNYLDDNSVMCATNNDSKIFIDTELPVLKIISENITKQQIDEFCNIVDIKKTFSCGPVNNQIICHRDIMKELFEYYQKNNIIEKIKDYVKSHKLTGRTIATDKRLFGYFAECCTLFWFNEKKFKIIPQEIVRENWY
jgi:hypothetical protein